MTLESSLVAPRQITFSHGEPRRHGVGRQGAVHLLPGELLTYPAQAHLVMSWF